MHSANRLHRWINVISIFVAAFGLHMIPTLFIINALAFKYPEFNFDNLAGFILVVQYFAVFISVISERLLEKYLEKIDDPAIP